VDRIVTLARFVQLIQRHSINDVNVPTFMLLISDLTGQITTGLCLDRDPLVLNNTKRAYQG
jgi:hypothetical protein